MNIAKNRPICKRVIYELCERFGCEIEDMYCSCFWGFSHGLRRQMRRMIWLNGNPRNLTLTYHDIDCSDCNRIRWEGFKEHAKKMDAMKKNV